MSFRPESLGATAPPAGVVDYRLARNAILTQFRKGRLSRLDVCDAQTELLRNATACGKPAPDQLPCPICESTGIVHVTYVFGSRLPASGRCISKGDAELARMNRSTTSYAAYVVEVCPDCRWNHLVRSFPLGRPSRAARS